MDTIKDLLSFSLILIPVAASARIVACLIYMQMDEDGSAYKKRIRNALIFTVLAECVVGLLDLVASYFGGGVIF